MTRFFIEADKMLSDHPILTGENAAHANVLRLKCGEEVTVCDGNGNECICAVESIGAGQVALTVLSRRASRSEAACKVSVYAAFPKADKLEHIIQKSTELGAFEIVVFPSERCISRPDEKSLGKKAERWRKIAASAAEQSGRGRIPEIVVLNSYAEAVERASRADKAILFYENEHTVTLHAALGNGNYGTVSLMTGPEGGFERSEVEKAEDAGMQICSLGTRILRCETAPLCALSAVMYACGEF